MDCFFCGTTLPDGEPGDRAYRGVVAYDPWLGRLWRVCSACRHWTPVPFQDRWEAVESCERLARDEASVVLETEHLSLLRMRRGQMIRVRGAPRPELADWRYSSLLERFRPRRRGVLARLLALPEPPVGGYLGVDFQGGGVGVPTPWIGSPFIAHGAVLTGLFTSVPLATTCPTCGGPFVVEPAAFADVRLLVHAGSPSIAATCGFCRAEELAAIGDGELTDVPGFEAFLARVRR